MAGRAYGSVHAAARFYGRPATAAPLARNVRRVCCGHVRGRREVDPFPDDTPIYAVDASNAAEHAAQLSEGLKALLEA